MRKILYLKTPTSDEELRNTILRRLYEIHSLHKRESYARKQRNFGQLLNLLKQEEMSVSGEEAVTHTQTYRIEGKLKQTRDELKAIRKDLKTHLKEAKKQNLHQSHIQALKNGIKSVDNYLRQVNNAFKEIRREIRENIDVDRELYKRAA